MDYEQVINVLAREKSMYEEELRATKSKLKLYDSLGCKIKVLDGSLLQFNLDKVDPLQMLACKCKLQMQATNANASCKCKLQMLACKCKLQMIACKCLHANASCKCKCKLQMLACKCKST
ncbi:hypothetical protein Tco_1132919 [Tanacetum coccineum]|uniref:Uncharacterized protein n=1 Tax=Tanacetum coccineum TaxID=301880 RepID=A0ABQ5JDE5_9ASTR